LPKNQTFTNGHSICPYCQQRLSWIELVPIFSFIMQEGKCSYCKKRISVIYPIGECATGVLFAFSFMQIGFHIELLTALLFISMLMIILISDIKYMLIPDKVRSEEHTSELQSRFDIVCRLLLEKKKLV